MGKSKKLKIIFILTIVILIILGGNVFSKVINEEKKGISLSESKNSDNSQKDNSQSYNDVLVIVNDNSIVSQQIGDYFADLRNIPSLNIIHVNVPTTEEISPIEFSDLRLQIENYILLNPLLNNSNYIVTTKGMPLKINSGDGCSSNSSSCASVESELTLILGPYNNSIQVGGKILSPYIWANNEFLRSEYGIFLVTRLDGYNFDQIKSMINNATQPIQVPSSAKFMFDQDPAQPSGYQGFNNRMAAASSLLNLRGHNAILESTTEYLTNQTNVIGYVSFGSNDHNYIYYSANGAPNNQWLPGSIAETYVSTSARTFNYPPSYGQSLIADLVKEGITGAKGYVYEPFTIAMADVYILFDKYTSNYTLAESFYRSSKYLSWMDVIVGDPKTRIIMPEEGLPIELYYFYANLTRNNNVGIYWGTLSETNNYGFYVQRSYKNTNSFRDIPRSFTPGYGTTNIPQHYQFIDNPSKPGNYYYRLKQIDLDGTINYIDPIRIRFYYKHENLL